MKKKRSFLEEAIQQAILKEQERIIKALDEADSACSGWAIAIVKGDE